MTTYSAKHQTFLLGQKALIILQKEKELAQLKKEFEIDQARVGLLQDINLDGCEVTKIPDTEKTNTNIKQQEANP